MPREPGHRQGDSSNTCVDDFVTFTEHLLTQPALLLRMSAAAREYALSTSWEQVFDDMYKTYERCLYAGDTMRQEILNVARV